MLTKTNPDAIIMGTVTEIEMIDKLMEIAEVTDPKFLSRKIKHYPELVKYLDSFHGSNLNEKAYNAIHGDSHICKYGNQMKFRSFTYGYRMCGNSGTCRCKRDIMAGEYGAISMAAKKRTSAEQAKINQKRRETCLEKYGAANGKGTRVMIPNIKDISAGRK